MFCLIFTRLLPSSGYAFEIWRLAMLLKINLVKAAGGHYLLTAMITPGVHKKKRLRNTSSPKWRTQYNTHGLCTPGMGGTLALRIVIYRVADKSSARPGRKQANVSVRMAWIAFGALPCRGEKKNLTARVSMLLKSHASLLCFRVCFLPGRAKDLSAPR